MKANELRIGNWVTLSLLDNTLKKDISLNKKQLIGLLQGNQFLSWPIPLTEEWLERLGLIKKNITEDMPEGLQKPDVDKDGSVWYYWVQGLFNLEIQSNGEIWFEVYSHYIHVKYVHQLQNLYHALTNEELAMK